MLLYVWDGSDRLYGFEEEVVDAFEAVEEDDIWDSGLVFEVEESEYIIFSQRFCSVDK